METKHTHSTLTLEQAWENAAKDKRSAEAVFTGIVSKITEQSNGERNDLAAHEAARTLIGYFETIIHPEVCDDESPQREQQPSD